MSEDENLKEWKVAEDENLEEHRVMEEYIMNGTAGSLWLPMTKRVYNQLVAVGDSTESMIKVNYHINNEHVPRIKLLFK